MPPRAQITESKRARVPAGHFSEVQLTHPLGAVCFLLKKTRSLQSACLLRTSLPRNSLLLWWKDASHLPLLLGLTRGFSITPRASFNLTHLRFDDFGLFYLVRPVYNRRGFIYFLRHPTMSFKTGTNEWARNVRYINTCNTNHPPGYLDPSFSICY